MSRDEKKKQREAVQLAWRMLTIEAESNADDVAAAAENSRAGKAADALVEAFPEYLGPAA